jgi:hypothetical protein
MPSILYSRYFFGRKFRVSGGDIREEVQCG